MKQLVRISKDELSLLPVRGKYICNADIKRCAKLRARLENNKYKKKNLNLTNGGNKMAEGCNLYSTRSDIKQLKDARNVGQKPGIGKIARDILNTTLTNDRQELMKVLRDKNHPHHKLTQNLLVNSLGKDKVTKQEENRLTGAFLTVLKDHHKFAKAPKYRGHGAKEMKHPYELLSTAALIQREFPTSLGNKLKIYSSDRLDFGQKFGADILVGRGSKVIGIDGKYTNGDSYGVITERQLKSIRSGFNDGQIQEFYFVTNKQFTSGFKGWVEFYNFQIIKEKSYKNQSLEKEFKSLEIELSGNRGDIQNEILKKNDSNLKKLSRKYHIPQIGMCEHVNYEGH